MLHNTTIDLIVLIVHLVFHFHTVRHVKMFFKRFKLANASRTRHATLSNGIVCCDTAFETNKFGYRDGAF